MFTELIKKGNWSYMFLAVVATLAVAALATLANSHTEGKSQSRAKQNSEQTITRGYPQYNETTMRFIN
jgi:hypothetical protein